MFLGAPSEALCSGQRKLLLLQAALVLRSGGHIVMSHLFSDKEGTVVLPTREELENLIGNLTLRIADLVHEPGLYRATFQVS